MQAWSLAHYSTPRQHDRRCSVPARQGTMSALAAASSSSVSPVCSPHSEVSDADAPSGAWSWSALSADTSDSGSLVATDFSATARAAVLHPGGLEEAHLWLLPPPGRPP